MKLQKHEVIIALLVLAAIFASFWAFQEAYEECRAEGHSRNYCMILLSR